MRTYAGKTTLFLLFLLFTSPVFATVDQDIDCLKCHTCPEPTMEESCLKPCPHFQRPEAAASHSVKEAPDQFIIDELSDLYQAVTFNHKLHADMAEMGLHCETCHHYSPAGEIPPCKECHGGEKNPANLRQPSLKGAYHRMCLSCHREWSHDTKCIVCHLPVEGKMLAGSVTDSTDIIGISHPKISTPDRKIYNTPYKEGPIVTFYHEEHVELFGLRCVDCHQQENCSYCHDLQEEAKPKKTGEEIHAICKDCHELCDDCPKDNCQLCHAHEVKPGFTHPSSWKQSKYHEGLECRNCHPTGKQITKVSGKCTNCHAGWNFNNFRHEVTGLRIDELHVEFECEDCHVNKRYHDKPDCSGCHDDGRTAEDAPPGEYLN